MTRFASLCLALCLVVVGPAVGQTTPISLTDVQEAYDDLDGLGASFTQVIGSEFAGDTTRVEGTVLLSGNKYRVQTPDQIVVTDGATTWIYTPSDSQVVVNDADQEESTVTPETFLTASAERYEVDSSSTTSRLGEPHVRLAVSATTSSARFTEATLWIRQSDRIVTRMKAEDRNGATLDLRLHDLAVNPDTLDGNDPFTFSPPEGVEVIDLRRSE